MDRGHKHSSGLTGCSFCIIRPVVAAAEAAAEVPSRTVQKEAAATAAPAEAAAAVTAAEVQSATAPAAGAEAAEAAESAAEAPAEALAEAAAVAPKDAAEDDRPLELGAIVTVKFGGKGKGGYWIREGHVIRAGFGPYEGQYRVKFADDGSDKWVDGWRCSPSAVT